MASRFAGLVLACACASVSASPPPPPVGKTDAPTFWYLDALASRVVARVLREDQTADGNTEVTVSAGAELGVTTSWRASVLDGDGDVPLAAGELAISRVDKRVAVGTVRLPVQQLAGHTRVRLEPPRPPGARVAVPRGAPNHIARIEIHYSFASIHCGNDKRYAIEWTGRGYRSAGKDLDPALVAALAAALRDVAASDRDRSCTSHTDDYPRFEIALGEDPAAPAAVVESSSNCSPDNAPWNVVRDGRRFAQDRGAIGDAVHALLTAIDPERWPLNRDPRFNWYTACERGRR